MSAMDSHTSPGRLRLVVVGNGMVGHRLLTTLADLGVAGRFDITVLGEERRPAYDRVALSSVFSGKRHDELSMVADGFFEQHGIALHLGDAVTAIDRPARRDRKSVV